MGIACSEMYVDTGSPFALKSFVDGMSTLLNEELKNGYKSIVFICIGTDRSTGDSLGPVIGYKLSPIRVENVYVHGTLDNPVHAKNLDETIAYVRTTYPEPLIVAIDACLGREEHIGYITMGRGAIKPGSAMKKNLCEVGDIYITGIVNFGGAFDFLILQNTRLHTVMKIADIVSSGIRYILWNSANYDSICKIAYKKGIPEISPI